MIVISPTLKRRLIGTAKLLLVLAVFGWIAWELYKSWHKINLIAWKPDYYWLTLSGVFYVVAYVPSAIFWRYAMRSLGQRPGWYESFRAYYIGHLGKYIPGKAVVVVLRSGLLRHDRTRASVAAAAVFLETLTMMATGAFLSALIVVVWFRDMPRGGWLTLIALGMMLVAGLPVVPPIFRSMAKRLGVGRGDPELDEKWSGLGFRTLAVGWMLTGIGWILLGLSLWATIRGIGMTTGPLLDNLPRFTLAAALSVVLGFVLMVPGGLGIREFAMAQVLTFYFVDLLLRGDSALGGNVKLTVEEAHHLAAVQGIVVAGMQRVVSIFAELTVSALLIRKPKSDTEDVTGKINSEKAE